MVDVQKTIKGLLSKFQAKKDFENRKIVFWYDHEKNADENIDEIRDELTKHNIKTAVLDNNYFEIKKCIEHDFPESDFLLYTQEKERPYEQNWLLDIQIYSSRFDTSQIAEVKSLFNIDGSLLDEFIEGYYPFFNNKLRVDALKKINFDKHNINEFKLAFLAVLTKNKSLDFNKIVRDILMNSMYEDENEFWQEIEKYNLTDDFWYFIKKHFWYVSDHPKLLKLFHSFIVTHIYAHTNKVLKSFDQYVNKNEKKMLNPNCEIFLSNWLRDSKDFNKYVEYSIDFIKSDNGQVEEKLKEQFGKEDLTKLQEVESLDFFDKIIILEIVKKLISNGQDYSRYKSLIINRKNKVWYKNYKEIYKALENAIDLFDFINNEKIEQKTLSVAYDLYKNKYYFADRYYRKFYEYYDQVTHSDILKQLKVEVEKLYHNKFLEKLFDVWSVAIDHENKKTWSIGTNPSQNEFYKLYVEKYVKSNNKVVVIISDALRYEIATELQEELQELRGIIELVSLVGLVPSITKIGMASLLPHKKLSYTSAGVFCDDNNTQGSINREKILQIENKLSKVIKFTDWNEYTRQQKRDIFKGQSIVYIYHDVIDETGDNAKSEHKVFLECKTAINDIKGLIKDLTNSVSASNIIVTADHGFLYKRELLVDFDKIQNPISKDNSIDAKKRCLVSKENIEIDNTHKFKLDYADEGVYAYVPKGPLRFKIQGSGVNFVHGGISPQEITIPVLTYKHIRSDKELDKKQIRRGFVNITLLNTSRKITTNIAQFNLYQTEKVTDRLKPITCKIYLFDLEKNERISDEKEIIANSNSEEPDNRKYYVSLTLKSNIENKKYYLKIFKVEEDKEELIPFDVDLAMSNDFEDF